MDGKFLRVDGRRFFVKGVAYGTFAPDADGSQFPPLARAASDFAAMAAAGINTVRTYTAPSPQILDAAAAAGLRVIIGIPWSQHVAFLDDAALKRQIRHEARAAVGARAGHPAALLFAVGNEIPPAVVRWHGHRRIERFLREMYDEIKSASPDSLLTYVNFPPTEYLEVDCFDVCAFNVYLHRETDLRAYLARLHHVAGARPLLLAEAGADSCRQGLEGQARITAMHLRAAFAEGACGAVAFSWTDEWWRGGHPVDDWAFGLVDAERRAKPALEAVRQVFAEVPFPAAERSTWPRASVVVCAYNAADTIDDCLTSLARLTYPDLEVIVVNDGSTDDTGARARMHAGVRVLEVANGGLSAARNVGLAEATGEIIAYTDADVRVDPDWLTYLVQPLLKVRLNPNATYDELRLKPDATYENTAYEFVGAGGPNVVPADDPLIAQCIARAPGGPTHVLLDDRIAEHVPGCNMAFRRDALLAIGGFNPVFLRAGDDVDICWRLQALGHRIAFSAAAHVWHHHRTTIEAYWRQQVGYGEGEAWLHVHHPEKFAGGEMLWRGRIYSPLPFVQSLRERRVNSGVWGTAAFPSVYFTAAPPLHLLPHSPLWLVLASLFVLAGATVLPAPTAARGWLLGAGLFAWAVTVLRCVMFAARSDLQGMCAAKSLPRRIACRAVIASLHLLQPLARLRGRIRGMWSAPQVAAPERGRQPWKPSLPSVRDALASGRLLIGLGAARSFWSESWIAHTTILSDLAGVLRASRPAQLVEVDDGWHADRDLSVAVGSWARLHTRVLVEEHAQGRCLIRVDACVRPTSAGTVKAVALALLMTAATAAASTRGSDLLLALAGMVVGTMLARAAWQTTRALAVFDRAVERVAAAAGMLLLPPHGRRRRQVQLRPSAAIPAVQAVVVVTLLIAAGVMVLTRGREPQLAPASVQDVDAATGGGVAVGLAGDLFVADAERGLIRRLRPRPPLGDARTANDIGSDGDPLLGSVFPFGAVADLTLAPNSDLYVADPANNRICRIVRSTAAVVTLAGVGTPGFSGDGSPAQLATLNGPTGIAVAPDGSIYVADTLNNRIRVIDPSGSIDTVAGDGRTDAGSGIGDGGPAERAHLNRPSGIAVAHNGDIFIADTGHHRIRRIAAATGIITTVAGTGAAGDEGDGGLAMRARLSAPIGLALAPTSQGPVVYIADSGNGRIRMVAPDGLITTVQGERPVIAPTRIAYHPAGWLYVKDSSPDGITALEAFDSADLAAAVHHLLRPFYRKTT